MNSSKSISLHRTRIYLSICCIILSGLGWFLANELNGDFWYLLWLAPVPVLLISFKVKGKIAFVIAYIAYTIGRLSWFGYLHET
ncbi:MAG: hypothetical protein ABIU55_02180, partial [Ferruginibacter sp.]